jgi:tRNA pseudouridine13 synthase
LARERLNVKVSQLEMELGIEVYTTRSAGIGGVIRQRFEDFEVEEVLVDGSRARTNQDRSSPTCRPLGSSLFGSHHLLCLLVKRNWDTLSVVKNIADQLGISMARIHTAGMKDARAVTAQHISIEDASIEDVQKVQVKDVELRALGYVREELSSFYLLSNAFRITIGSINHSKPIVEGRIQRVVQEVQAAGGIPNFFGHQRFGTTRPITHQVGREIVHGDFEKAVMFLLAAPSPHEHPDSRRAREELQSRRNFKAAETNFPKQLR